MDIECFLLGFIGLVVGLGVIFIISCAGVFFLLHYRPHGGRTTRDKSGEIGKEVPKRRGTLFGFRSKNPRKGGWVPAPESADDDWDDGFDRVRGERTSTTVHSANDTELGDAGKFTHTIQPNRASLSLSNEVYSSSEDKGRDKRVPHSTELVAQTHNRGFDHLYNDPFGDRGRSPGPIRSPSPERYEESIRSRSVSPRDQQHGHRSTASASSTVSLPSGTRFMESL